MSVETPKAFELAFASKQVESSLKTAILVGTILNLINQWDALFAETALNWGKIALTYLVPYLVSTYAGVRASLRVIQENV